MLEEILSSFVARGVCTKKREVNDANINWEVCNYFLADYMHAGEVVKTFSSQDPCASTRTCVSSERIRQLAPSLPKPRLRMINQGFENGCCKYCRDRELKRGI